MYKILIIKNRYDKKVDFSKCFEWFKTHTPIQISAEEKITDFDFTTLSIHNGTFSGVIAGNLEQLRTVVPENTYNAVVLVYGNNLDGIRVSCCNGLNGAQNLYPNTEIIQLAKVTWETLNHELFHAFFAKANRKGARLNDNMDTYLRDSVLDTDNGETNRTIALQSLAPHWSTILSLSPVEGIPEPKIDSGAIVTLTRIYEWPGKETVGKLESSIISCRTLELPWKNNQVNISCIPTGTYQVKFTRSLKFPQGTYQIQNVPGRSGIRFHKGNYGYKANGTPDIEGCILLGNAFNDLNKDGIPEIVESTVAVKAFETAMQKKPFTLIVK